jgi:hypothetical protein
MRYADMKHDGIDFALPESTETFEVLKIVPHKEIPSPKVVTANHITSAEASGRIRIFKNDESDVDSDESDVDSDESDVDSV